MDFLNILLFCLMSCIIGAVLMLLLQYYAFVRYFKLPEESETNKTLDEKFTLPDAILSKVHSANPEDKNSIVAVNLVLQFLYNELRHSNQVRKWFYRKLSLELDELISKTTTGKLFDKLSIRDLDLGSQFPEIKNLKVHNVELHDNEGHIESLDVLLDLQYRGNFRLSIDADMVLGKKGFLSLKVQQISGLARLQFTRKPYTHWSLSFVGEPKLELGVESQFQGRQMQSNVTSLISNQIRKAIKRKHTLPNYKLRYKPFFNKTDDELETDTPIDGNLEVNISELTRLMSPSHITHVYCTITLATIPWVQARQQDDKNLTISLDLEIHKAKNQQIGIVFKQTEHTVMVEAVIPNTPAAKAKLIKGDILISIEGKKVSNISHVAKLIKSLNRPMFILRIERIVPGLIKNDAVLEDYEVYEDFNDMNISFSKNTDSVQIGKKITRKNSTERATSSDSSLANTPSNSPRKTVENPLDKIRSKGLSRNNSDSKSPADDTTPVINRSIEHFSDTDFIQHSTVDCYMNSFIRMDDLSNFKLSEFSQYFNLNVYGRNNEESILLGYLNIPINSIIAECNESHLGHYLKQYSLIPPDSPNVSNHPLSSLSGFDPYLCFGDVLLAFAWTGTMTTSTISSENLLKKQSSGSVDKLDDDKQDLNQPPKQHDFIRTHFHRATQCDFCGKKIWLKDAVQCRECAMCCHKKCVTKCQNSTVCGNHATMTQPELILTEPSTFGETDDFDEIDDHPKYSLDAHRQSFSDLLAQGLKRVNSANNLSIPGISSSLGQGSRSLPPSPQHTPRKQSLVNQTNPFISVTHRLENFPDDISDLTREHISNLTEPIIGNGTPEELMGLAKNASKNLYGDLEPQERVDKINSLLSKLRIALDHETTEHANLEISSNLDRSNSISNQNINTDNIRISSDTTLLLQTKPPQSSGSDTTPKRQNEHEMAKKAFLIGQSEERVQALSVIMLYLCSGLQYAQGVAGQ